jgi:DNA-binding CsgD family transcriptional regulator
MRESDDVSTVHVLPAFPDGDAGPLPTGSLHRNIEQAICAFGRDILTAREQAVVQLILRGLSSKVVASELQIALKTEKVHRRNAYAKLGVNSHGVLFGQFLQFLSTALEPSSQTGFVEPRDPTRIAQDDRARTESPLMSARSRRDRSGSRAGKDVAPTLRHPAPRDARHR